MSSRPTSKHANSVRNWAVHHKWASSLLLVLVCSMTGLAAWSMLRPSPLLFDSFNTNWIDPLKWKTGRRSLTAEDGHVRLNNRGSLQTVHEYAGPIDLHLRWRWIDMTGDTLYRDCLTVALRTTGKHRDAHSFEIEDGICIQFEATGGQIICDARPRPEHPPRIAGRQNAKGSTPMPAGAWHDIRITDDGKTIRIYFSGPASDPKQKGRPALEFDWPDNSLHHHIAIYNRELIAGAIQESHIDDVKLNRLTSSD